MIHLQRKIAIALVIHLLFGTAQTVWSQQETSLETAAKAPSDWNIKHADGRQPIAHWKLDVTLRSEPQPALRYRFIDDDYDLKDWNAAIFYLRAFGYLDREVERNKLIEYWNKAFQDVKGQNKQAAPTAWLEMRPSELPLEEVKKFLALTEFQVPDLKEAQKCKSMNFDRHIHDLQSPASLALPEIKRFRSVSRDQRLRFRVAIAENRLDDAMTILRQQFAMVRHLSEDYVLISNLVGMSVAHLALDDTLHLIEHPKSPNLYWALATLPNPLVSTKNSIGFERRFLLEEIKPLKEVDLAPHDAAFWNDIIERIAASLSGSEIEGWPRGNVQELKAHLIKVIANSRPQATAYLHDVEGIASDQLDKLDDNHLGILALVRFYKNRADQFAKWTFIPHWQRVQNPAYTDFLASEDAKTIGELTNVSIQFIAGLQPIYNAEVQIAQKIALLQAIEALRMHAADHDGKLPESLNDTPVPVPVDPANGQPFQYVKQGDKAELTAVPLGMREALQIELHLRAISQLTK